ncbi:MAG: deoxynucleoside kinase [Firmicutes bacterium]|nr:deoxynucleoside kinase [Bacillota bacterium]MDY5586228.1 thymidylate kinase [Eubacteriales bacterium]
MKGKFIVIEGTDGSGKKTQAKILCEKLNEAGINCIVQSFPNYDSPACTPVKMYLNGEFGDIGCLDAYQANSLYAVDRLCTMMGLKDHIENGGSIVFDRYVESTMLHQAALIENQEERDKFLDYVNDFEFEKLKLPKPDLVIFLDVPVEVSKKLADSRGEYKSGNKKDILEQDISHLTKAYNSGKYVANKYGWTQISCLNESGNLKSIEEISNDIFEVVKKLFNK